MGLLQYPERDGLNQTLVATLLCPLRRCQMFASTLCLALPGYGPGTMDRGLRLRPAIARRDRKDSRHTVAPYEVIRLDSWKRVRHLTPSIGRLPHGDTARAPTARRLKSPGSIVQQ